jgi:hypothetical protein
MSDVSLPAGISFPVRASEHEAGVLIDASDNVVCIVDLHREIDDEVAHARTAWIAAAINAFGGSEPTGAPA